MASWPPLSQKINYLLASQSIVWYLLREITEVNLTYDFISKRYGLKGGRKNQIDNL